MIVYKDEAAAARASRLRDHGMSPERRYWHLEAGFNYRLTNLQAAVGVAQMERVDEILQRKRTLAEQYAAHVSGVDGISLPPHAAWADPVCWLYTVRVEDELGLTRDELASRLLVNGIETRPVFEPLHLMPPFERFAGDGSFPVTDEIAATGLRPSVRGHASRRGRRRDRGEHQSDRPRTPHACGGRRSGLKESMRLRAAIVGLGQVGMLFDDDPSRDRTWTHFSAYERLSDRFELVAVCDPDPARRATAADRRPAVCAFAALDEMLDSEPFDVISICTPIPLHARQVEACAPHARAIVCEKPLSADVPAAESAVGACAASGTLLAVNYYKRFESASKRPPS